MVSITEIEIEPKNLSNSVKLESLSMETESNRANRKRCSDSHIS